MIFGSLFARKKDEEEKKKYEKQNPQKIFFTKNISEEEKINKNKIIININMQERVEHKEVALFYVEELHKEPVRIKHIQELAKYQLPLKAKIPGDERSYFTTVEKVAMTKGGEYIVLMKEFENPKYKENLKVGDKVEFEYSDSVGKYSFSSIFKGTYKTSLIFSFPEKIERKAGRSAFRVKPNPAEPVEVNIELPGGGVFKGNMVDINEHGMGLDVEIPKDGVKVMDIVKLSFRLPTKENQKKHEWAIVSTKAEVRSIGDGEEKKTRLGLQFTEISEDDRKIIREYWLMRQREELKRKLEYES
jgi:c-di-GMP-binding flagellar brake protein YcgR